MANWTHDNITCPSSNVIKVPMPSPSEQYWNRVVLQRSSSLDETGHVVWHLALCLLLSCMIIAAVLIKGIKSSGKELVSLQALPSLDCWVIWLICMDNLLKLWWRKFINIEVLVTILCDSYPNVLKSRRGFVTFGICSLLFLLGLPCVTQAGIYWVHLLDKFAGSWLILIMVLSELIGFCYIYGVKNLIADIEMMIGKKSSTYWLIWKCSWLIITPVIAFAVLLWSLISVTRPVYGEVLYPDWGTAMGWCVVAFVLIPIPGAIVYKVFKGKGSFWKQVKALTSPSEDWHPYLDIHCVDRYSKEIVDLHHYAGPSIEK